MPKHSVTALACGFFAVADLVAVVADAPIWIVIALSLAVVFMGTRALTQWRETRT